MNFNYTACKGSSTFSSFFSSSHIITSGSGLSILNDLPSVDHRALYGSIILTLTPMIPCLKSM